MRIPQATFLGLPPPATRRYRAFLVALSLVCLPASFLRSGFAFSANCKKVLSDTVEQVSFDDLGVKALYASRWKGPALNEVIHVGKQSFRFSSELGRASATVYLALDETAKAVVVKRLNERVGMLKYEKAITEFYRAEGIDAPAILAIDEEQGVLVKEYIEGVKTSEISMDQGNLLRRPSDKGILLDGFKRERERIEKVRTGFKKWMKTHYPDILRDLSTESALIEYGDHRSFENSIFSVAKKKWILIDP